jgi:hypothetical protein
MLIIKNKASHSIVIHGLESQVDSNTQMDQYALDSGQMVKVVYDSLYGEWIII